MSIETVSSKHLREVEQRAAALIVALKRAKMNDLPAFTAVENLQTDAERERQRRDAARPQPDAKTFPAIERTLEGGPAKVLEGGPDKEL